MKTYTKKDIENTLYATGFDPDVLNESPQSFAQYAEEYGYIQQGDVWVKTTDTNTYDEQSMRDILLSKYGVERDAIETSDDVAMFAEEYGYEQLDDNCYQRI